MVVGAAVLALAGASVLGRALACRLPRRPNHRGRAVAQGAGVALALPAILAARMVLPRTDALALLTGSLAMGLTGLLDDVASAGEPRGWLGHGRELLRGSLTCGALKALTGIAVALAVDWRSAPLLALGPNLVNTVDTRPGRAIGLYLLAAVPLIWLSPAGWLRAVPFGAAALGLWPLDLGERLMLGDTGANALGFALAFAWAAAPAPVPLWAAAAALAVIVVGDRLSLGRLGMKRFASRRSQVHPGE
jgi:UDP-N-acetylmuramyl pentapeptide phosphotransferase/UDP-N-acetylglucosamine-1-phosphate transferase